ncbi:hypothetical protein L7F22_045313 [Adiantum nelumboides]|nr:hypothetical protein [Adiantum nelumboides]
MEGSKGANAKVQIGEVVPLRESRQRKRSCRGSNEIASRDTWGIEADSDAVDSKLQKEFERRIEKRSKANTSLPSTSRLFSTIERLDSIMKSEGRNHITGTSNSRE